MRQQCHRRYVKCHAPADLSSSVRLSARNTIYGKTREAQTTLCSTAEGDKGMERENKERQGGIGERLRGREDRERHKSE